MIAAGCVYEHNGTFKLHCEDHQYIDMLYAWVGRSAQQCRNNRTCCPQTNICSRLDQDLITQQVTSCNEKQQCELTVGTNSCSTSSKSYDTDYELVTYRCYNKSMGKFPLNCSIYFIYRLEKYGNSRMV